MNTMKSLIHDLAEAVVGGYTLSDNLAPAEKSERERTGLRQLLGVTPFTQGLSKLWDEFEAGVTPEGQWLRQVDRLEMAAQATNPCPLSIYLVTLTWRSNTLWHIPTIREASSRRAPEHQLHYPLSLS
ncbi:MAG: HD domain-containing protein [Motiliproteus sp.]